MFEYESIPAHLDEMEPGPVLAAFLSSIDAGELSEHDRIVALRARSRMVAHYTAQMYADMAAVVDVAEHTLDPFEAAESASAEIRLALCLTRRTADTELELALHLRQRLPQVFALLANGKIDLRRARTIAHGTRHLPTEVARQVVEQVINDAPTLTTGQLRARLRRLCIDTDPADAQRRYEDAVAERRIVAEPTESGTAHLFGSDLPPHRVAAVTERINRLARSLKTADEERTMDQLRADVYLDILTGTTGGQGGTVDIRVDLNTLIGLAEDSSEVRGYGPVIADIARQIADQQAHPKSRSKVRSQWRYTVTDPETNQPLHTGITRRRPTAPQRRTVEASSETCVFPGCRVPSTACDLDHTIPYREGGPTTVDNLEPLCRHHHRIRHLPGWAYQPLPRGDHQWTTPSGHQYTTTGRSP